MLTLTSLTIWLGWEQAGRSGILALTSLKIWCCWEQAGSGGSGFAGRGETSFAGSGGAGLTGRGETGFAGSKPIAVDWASLVGVKVALQGVRREWWIRLRW